MRNLQRCAATMRALRDCRLYGIIDLGYIPRVRDCSRIAEQMVTGGVDLIQLRGKGKSIDELVNLASEIHEITAPSSTPLIVNDHAEIAAEVPVEEVMPRPTPHENRSADAQVGDEMPRPTFHNRPSEGQIRSPEPPFAINGREVPRAVHH